MTCDQLSGIIEERSKIDRLKGEGAGKKIGAIVDRLGDTMSWQCYVSFLLIVRSLYGLRSSNHANGRDCCLACTSDRSKIEQFVRCPPTCAALFAAACCCR
jgi:hypothetical protein